MIVKYFNRYSNSIEIEKVMGGEAMKKIYGTWWGRIIEWILTSNNLFSNIVGEYYKSKFSKKKIKPFISDFNINTKDFRYGSIRTKEFHDSFKTFDEFFTRDLVTSARTFSVEKKLMPAFAEGRYFATESIHDILKFPVKGSFLRVKDLIPSEESIWFEQGPMLIARLCPTDYHRYHYPDDGTTYKSYQRFGRYHSVNPIALKYKPECFIKNERRVSILHTNNFGYLAFIEVGALFVGAIDQVHNENEPFKRGDLKGMFHFGGSTVIVIGEKDRWTPSSDLLEQSYQGLETFVKLGDTVATL